jgi:hypothetical protein
MSMTDMMKLENSTRMTSSSHVASWYIEIALEQKVEKLSL